MALVSQEYESLEAFINQADAGFHLQTLWAGPDLTFGSSGIELVDLDQDGDMDVLYTNGDAFDNSYAKPSHGVQWLENLGGLEFAYHRLTDMPGVTAHWPATSIWTEISTSSRWRCFLRQVMPREAAQRPPASILCLEQTSPGVFARHTLEAGSPYYATIELAVLRRRRRPRLRRRPALRSAGETCRIGCRSGESTDLSEPLISKPHEFGHGQPVRRDLTADETSLREGPGGVRSGHAEGQSTQGVAKRPEMTTLRCSVRNFAISLCRRVVVVVSS